jgi:endonuclease/exonuclease/phosphatase (EEP) superfamily protein YafD
VLLSAAPSRDVLTERHKSLMRLHVVWVGWVALVIALVALHVVVPQRFGALALTQIFEPYIMLTGLVGGLLAFRSSSVAGRALFVTLTAVAVLRYAPAWISVPPAGHGDPLRVSAWNIEAGENAANRVLTGIASSNAEIIGLAELQPDAAAALERGAGRLEFHALSPHENVLGVGLLSRFPILEHETSIDPPFMRAVVDPMSMDPVVVYVVHPLPGRFVRLGDIPVGIDTSVREVAIDLIRDRIEEDVAARQSVIVLGDINATERDPAYAELSAGLRDAHLDAGLGPGFTWRPSPLSFLPFGMLRIDYVLSTPDLQPTSATVDCSLPSDHCRVDADLTMTRLPASAR